VRDEDRPAFLAALRRLGRRDYFRAELAAFLLKQQHSRKAVDAAVERCSEMGYLDDDRLASRFAESRAALKGWGPKKIRHELIGRGVCEQVADRASRLPGELVEKATEVALRRAETRAKPEWWRAGEGRARMVSSLLRRGFHADDAHRRVKLAAAQREASDHAENDQPGDPEGVS
jgi:regulatory protein